MARLLFVEDESLELLKVFFSRSGFDVYGARTAVEAEELATRYSPDVVVLDVMLQHGPDGEQDGLTSAAISGTTSFEARSSSLPPEPLRKTSSRVQSRCR